MGLNKYGKGKKKERKCGWFFSLGVLKLNIWWVKVV